MFRFLLLISESWLWFIFVVRARSISFHTSAKGKPKKKYFLHNGRTIKALTPPPPSSLIAIGSLAVGKKIKKFKWPALYPHIAASLNEKSFYWLRRYFINVYTPSVDAQSFRNFGQFWTIYDEHVISRSKSNKKWVIYNIIQTFVSTKIIFALFLHKSSVDLHSRSSTISFNLQQ